MTEHTGSVIGADTEELWYDDTIEDIQMPLSFAQQRLWLLDQLAPGSPLYNIPLVMRMTGNLNVQALEKSYNEMIFRHESLRTVFAQIDGEPVQLIREAIPLPIKILDIQDAKDVEAEIHEIAAAERARPFDLEKGPLSRLQLLKSGPEEHVLLLTMHHIISDGWSMNVFIQEIGLLYQAFSTGRPSPLSELPIQYADYACWQRDNLQGEALEEKLAYWRQKLSGELSVLQLPTDRPRPAVQTHRGHTRYFSLPMTVVEKLHAIGIRERATSYMICLAAFKILLSRYSGQTDLLVGSPIAGRNITQVEPLIGFFVNTLVMRTDLSGDLTFVELLRRVKQTTVDAYAHQDMPFEMLVADLQPERNLSHSPLFQVMFSLQNTPAGKLEVAGITFQQIDDEGETAKFDLTLGLQEMEDQLSIVFEYDTDLFDEATIVRMGGHFCELLTAIAEQPDARVAALPLLKPEELQQLLFEWNRNEVALPELPVHALFEQVAARMPEQTAIRFADQTVTYRELNERANRLARHLQASGIRAGQLVGVALERSVELYVAVLAILKAGGAYVPFDTAYPQERLSYMLEDTGITAMLTVQKLAALLPPHGAELCLLDDEQVGAAIAQESGADLPMAADSDSVAYVMYTSGTTGKPKGILTPHRGIVRLVYGTSAALPYTADDVALQYAPISFDGSTLEIWGALLNGATLVVYPPQQASVEEIGQTVQEQGVTVLFLTAGLFHQMVDTHPEGLRGLRLLASGGDVISAPHVQKVVGQLSIPFVNLYGPTEVTTAATAHLVGHAAQVGTTLPIGRPIANTTVYVLDERMQPVPIGVAGELHVGGQGIALGYLNRPELTAEKFVSSPFCAGERLYKTGDLVRWLADGTLEFMGRSDQQVKIRGFRIEPGEVEAVIEQHPAVIRSVVMAREDVPGLKRLVAYLILDPAAEADTGSLRAFLQGKLPDYMVPSAFVTLEEFPLNANQKVDYRALPAPEGRLEQTVEYVEPRDAAEVKVAELFAKLLGVQQVGAHDHFFELGGHSLLGARLVSRIREEFAAELTLRALFEHPTVAGLAKLLTGDDPSLANVQVPPLVKAERGDTIPLSYAQQRLWFLDQLAPDSSAYNMPAAFKLHGKLNVAAVQQSFREIVRRHESLRTSFQLVEETAVQVISPQTELEVRMIDLTNFADRARETELRRLAVEDATAPFDLQQGPLLRAALVRLESEEHALLVNMHHIISDGWSMSVLIEEFAALYSAFSQHQPSPLSELPVQFADYAIWQRRWMQGEVLRDQLDYWKSKLGGDLPVLEMPTDPVPEPNRGQSARQELTLSPNLTRQLTKLSHEAGASPFMTLLAAFKTLLHRLTGQEDLIVGTPIAGRGLVETEGLIGLLLNTVALRTDLSGAPTFREVLGRVRETVLEAFARQEVPFEKIVEEIQPDRNLNRNPVFDIMVNFVNTPSRHLILPGLTLSDLENDGATASKFQMSLYISEYAEQLNLSLVYQSALFSTERMEAFMEQFRLLLQQIATEPNGQVNNYPLVTEAARSKLPDPAAPIQEPQYPIVGELIAAWERRAPEHPAVTQGAQQWSYRYLLERANELAGQLAACGVRRGDAVAVVGTRSFGTITAMVGVLNSGGVLVPVDAALPKQRQQVMVEQSKAKHLISIGADNDGCALDITGVDPMTGQILGAPAPAQTALPDLSPDDPAYIFFTSGTTGVPKGVLGTHKGLSHFLSWQRNTFHIGPEDRVAQLIHLSFDAVLRDVFLPLTSGATLCLPDVTDDLGGDVILPWLERTGVTVLHTVPSVAQAWTTDPPQAITLRSLRHLFLAGEPLTDVLVNRLRSAFPEIGDIINLYGPTETTMVKCWYVVPERPIAGIQPAGDPFPETQALVLGANGQLAGIGEQGEIVLRTPFCTLGYVNAPDENKRFAPNPFRPHDPADLLYYTGDRGRYRPDGSLEILGRVDDQVKVRGVRIQLHEVSAVLLRHEAVDACAVIDWKDESGATQLAAYSVLKPGLVVTAEDIRAHFEHHLPAAMVPAVFLFLEELPRLANGKVNRKALPKPERGGSSADAYAAPRNEVEAMLVAIFCEVLKLDRVGVHDNFFTIGGHSLTATQVASRIRKRFEVEMPLSLLFERPTVAALAVEVERRQHALQPDSWNNASIAPVPRDGTTALPLSYAQQRLWFLDQLEPGSIAYNVPFGVRITGALNTDVLARTINEIVARHEALRTNFHATGGLAVQVIAAERMQALPVIDLQQMAAAEKDAQLDEWTVREVNTPFNLATDALLRTTLLKLGPEEHVLLITFHHIIGDGWSFGVFAQELTTIYAAFENGRPSPLERLPIQYADFAVWQREQLQGTGKEALLSYWKQRFDGDIPVLDLPTDRPRPAVQNFAGDTVRFELSGDLRDALLALSQQEGVTLYMTLLAAFNTLLFRYSGQEDIVLGAPIAARTRAEIEPLIGFFVNTLALRTDLSGNPSVRSLLQRVRATTLDAFAHQDLPLEMLIEELGIERDLSRSPLFQVAFLLQNTPAAAPAETEVTLEPYEAQRTTSKFDLTLMLSESEQGLSGNLEYRTDLFDRSTVERLAAHFGQLLAAIVENPDGLIEHLPLMSRDEERMILDDWSGSTADYPQDACLHSLFEQQAERTPDDTAVLFHDRSLTYRELNEKANQLAYVLQRRGLQAEQPVAILMDRAPELIVSILAVLKAGGAYVPLDPSVPAERLAYMLSDSQTSLLLTQQRHLNALPAHSAQVIAVDGEWERLALEDVANPPLDLVSTQLAYIIYTSGSTGRPKGVLLQHAGVCNTVYQHRKILQIGARRRMLQFSSPSFDASVLEIFTALTSGAALVMASKEQLMPGAGLAELIRGQEITDVILTPSVLALLPEHDLPSLCTVQSAGEACPAELAARWIRTGIMFINGYGPTETSIEATFSVNPNSSHTPDIGRPIPNCQVYILDRHLRPVPVGVQGELYIGGPGVARGYHNRRDLTEQSFLPHPYHADANQRLYKSGDMARWLPSGKIEYLGRRDQQVKIRGFRIETGEVEAVLTRHPHVEKAVVAPHTDRGGQKRLVAYYLAAPETKSSAQELRAFLGHSLPDYMVPAVFLKLDELPLSSSGKVDHRALPALHDIHSERRELLPPRTATEQTLVLLWQELLAIGAISRDDNFFEVGGHSLLATQLVSRIRETFDIELPLRTLFEAPTIETLALRLDELHPGTAGGPELAAFAEAGADDAPLSFAQRRLWFIDQLEPGSSAYNIVNLMRLQGPFDFEVFENSFAELVKRHESLRTVFPFQMGEPTQNVLDEFPLPLVLVDLQGMANGEALALQAAQTEAERPFDLAQGPLVRLHVYKLQPDSHLLLLVMHHIISDGWSMGVLVRELAALYDAFRAGNQSPLAPLPLQYSGYSRWQHQRFQGEWMQQQLGYWKRQLGGELPVLDLPTDRPRQPARSAMQAGRCAFELDAPLTQAIKELGRKQGATLYMTLLAAFQTLLFRYSGQTDILVGSPIAGRSHKELEQLIGFFINTLVLRTDLSGDPGFAELLQRVVQTTLNAYANQDVPFEMLVAELQHEREKGRTPLFQALFVLQNTPESGQEFPGLVLTSMPLESTTAKFELSLMMAESESGLQGVFEYSCDLWDAGTIERMSGHLIKLLESLTADPAQPVGKLPMLTAAEERQLLIDWNQTGTGCSGESTVHELVERYAATTPSAIALMFEQETMSYLDLNERANRLAHRLQKLGIGQGGRVGIYMERSFEMIVAMVAILKTGAAYVPFNVNDPQERLLYMLEDTQVGVLLTQQRLADRLPKCEAATVSVDIAGEFADECAANLEVPVSKDAAAYIMYTSGSTGQPKGVEVAHRGIVRLVREAGYAEFTSEDVFLQFAQIAFDASTLEIWGALLNGGKLAIFPPHQASLAELGAAIEAYGVTTLWLTAGLFHSMVEHHPEGLRGLRWLLAGGDVLSVPHVKKALEHFDGCLINGYGPTENTTFTTCHQVVDPSRLEQTVPIGRPVANTTVYVLDAAEQLVPVGVPGELYTGGAGLALGYLNQPELSAEKFVANPFGEGKLYRTGDLVRWMPCGELEFIGRIDSQVKVRGFRVEIGEIEAALVQHPWIREAVVIVREEGGSKRLAAYVTAEGMGELAMSDLTGFLQQTLPDYMIPDVLEVLADLPLNPNGKVDRKALAARSVSYEREAVFAAPQDRIELELLQLWNELLGDGSYGVTDDFFKVGGHSLLAVRLIAQIEKRFGQKLPLSVLFDEGTIRRLAARLRQGGQALPATPLVTIQSGLPGTAETPLFLVHPVGGSVFAYLDLARELGSDQPVYGLQARGLEDHRAPLVVMEEIAAEYVAAIRTVQQSGPYRLGGWSLGGSIAFAMAGQLRALGEEVELLALIDARAPLADYQREMDDQELLLAFARDLAGQHGLQLEELAHAELSLREDALAALLALAREHQVFGSDLGLEDLQRLLNVFRSNYTAFNRYAALHRAERVLLIQAENAESDAYGWTELAEEVEVHRIGGNHFTLLQAPHVQELAGIMKQHLLKLKSSV
ncbi:amino acid adenylation domain-containing protein [Tumebacillus sp. BK434]|uniref:amino acid adenylation domain-containing protein n=1 Tax=Tumebacillus sp. BK434 TaxID=2512169 RepID=UPI001048AB10|nr:non-ribosomal peptide synthetase [Tumebacillus sp. BK434]TCP59049.1 amino acid adenylation domain-containing protein [Tumebacillus sp. BK434]